MLDIMMPFGLPQTFYFAFSRLGDGYLALGGLDLTEQDAMRNQIITLNNELGNASRALQKANAELRQISELRNQFLAISAHDLRKPLAMIMYASRFLSREAEDRLEPDEMQLLEKIQEASTFMARLVDDFLDVSLAQAGQFVVSCKPTEIGPIISASCDIARTAAQREDVKLEVVVEDALPVLKVDAQRIQQALCNLVGNAFEHARPDTMVTVSARLMGSAVRVSVRDEGEGIPPEVRPRLFQSFERHGVYKSGGKRSVGLGLMIARRIVEAHRGRIWYETEEGVGSTFGFDLPLEDS
jgi:signal transduction histidine kinase